MLPPWQFGLIPDLEGGHSLDVSPVPMAPPTRTWQSSSKGSEYYGKLTRQKSNQRLTPHAGRAWFTLVALDVPLDKHGPRSRALGRKYDILYLQLADVALLAHPEHHLGLL